MDTAELRKARGAFFTPRELCGYLTDWAIRSPSDIVLEPSCGDAEFLLAAHARLEEVAAGAGLAPESVHGTLRAAELHEPSARAATQRLAALGRSLDVSVGDFFAMTPTGDVTAVLGNPPYVRYHAHAGADRVASRAAALRAGVALSGLASVWAAFTVHAAQFLAPGGRLALVLPAELLSTNYAAPVRAYLLEAFAEVGLVVFDERVFPGVQEEVVLLMADGFGAGPAPHLILRQVSQLADLVTGAAPERRDTTWAPRHPAAKWTPSLMPPRALDAFGEIVAGPRWSRLGEWGRIHLGAVTGNNGYFTMTGDQAAARGLTADELVRVSPPGSAHLRGLRLTSASLATLDAGGRPTWLFRPGDTPTEGAQRYLAEGEARGVPSAYKCRARSPWWQVPLLAPPDLFLTYMNADTPRLCANDAGAHHLNSVHGVYVEKHLRGRAAGLLPLASINSLTLVAAETVGRACGGGMLKIEPGEARDLPVPSPAVIAEHAAELSALSAHVEREHVALRGESLLSVAERVDAILFSGETGGTPSQLDALRAAHRALTGRRRTRGGGGHGR